MNSEVKLGILNALYSKKDLIQSALDHQDDEGFTFEHVFEMVNANQMQFFWNKDSCAIVEIRKYPGQTTIHVFLGAGTTEGLLELYERVADWGVKYVGASKMTTLCRKGFKRTLAAHGWEEPQVWLTKDIELKETE